MFAPTDAKRRSGDIFGATMEFLISRFHCYFCQRRKTLTIYLILAPLLPTHTFKIIHFKITDLVIICSIVEQLNRHTN